MRKWVFVTVMNCTLLLCSSGTIVQGAAVVFSQKLWTVKYSITRHLFVLWCSFT